MFGYAARRVLSAIPVALIAVTACFFILRLAPGGPFDGERALPPTTLANLRAHYNLDQPLITQYFIYIWRPAAAAISALRWSTTTSPSARCWRSACRSR